MKRFGWLSTAFVVISFATCAKGRRSFAVYEAPMRGESRIQCTLRSTSAEFFDPKAMQLHTAYSMATFRPASGT
jgi:hypothetical protein